MLNPYPYCRIIARHLSQMNWRLSLAESCTGGGLSAALVSVAGASAWLDRALVTYSNAAKTQELGVPAPLISKHGAVSAAVALAMAQGLAKITQCELVLSITGIAGPQGGTVAKPVGTVYVAVAGTAVSKLGLRNGHTRLLQLAGGRKNIQEETIYFTLCWLCDILRSDLRV